jgi:hypothetical protein
VLAAAWCVAAPTGAAPQQAGPRVVIVLDASLSMVVRERTGAAEAGARDGERRLDIAWRDIRSTVEHLARRQPDARVRLLVFGPRLPGAEDGLWERPSAPGAFLEARQHGALDGWWSELVDRAPRGLSRLDRALERALALGPDRVLLYTDGVPLAAPEPPPPGATPVVDVAATRIEREREQLLAGVRFWNRRTPPTPIDVVGVGAGLQGTRAFLAELAAATGGYFVATD